MNYWLADSKIRYNCLSNKSTTSMNCIRIGVVFISPLHWIIIIYHIFHVILHAHQQHIIASSSRSRSRCSTRAARCGMYEYKIVWQNRDARCCAYVNARIDSSVTAPPPHIISHPCKIIHLFASGKLHYTCIKLFY